MPNLQQLRDQRASAWEHMKGYIDAAEKDGWTADLEASYDTAQTDYDKLDSQIERMERFENRAVENSRVDLVKSRIGVAIKAGAPKPDIGSADAVRQALLAARSVAYSDSASGVYVSTEMFGKLGIAEQMKGKAKMIPATPVGEIVAKGEAEVGFQQISELKPVAGIDIVGPLPAELQKITVFSAGIATSSKEPEAGRALIKFLSSSPVARDEMVKSGLDPIASGATH